MLLGKLVEVVDVNGAPKVLDTFGVDLGTKAHRSTRRLKMSHGLMLRVNYLDVRV